MIFNYVCSTIKPVVYYYFSTKITGKKEYIFRPKKKMKKDVFVDVAILRISKLDE